MIQAYAIAEPSIDTSIGSPIRSIFDVVAESIAESYADQYLLSYQYDIDSKSGADLDAFVALFGFTRFAAKRATGSVTFSRISPAPQDIYISGATQLTTPNTPPVVFNTLMPVVLVAGNTSCSVPVQAQVGGSSGNVAANTITRITTQQMGVSSVTNPVGCSGGSDPESDADLRTRFKATVFRALTGTVPMFTAVGLDDPDVSKVNVIGAAKTYNEMVQVVGGVATSSVQDFKYFYVGSDSLGADLYFGDIFTNGIDYTIQVDPLTPPLSLAVGTSTSSGYYGAALTINYAVSALNVSGESLACTPVAVTTGSGSTNSNSLTWTAESGADSYNVYVDTGGGLEFLANTDSASFVDTGAVAGSGNPPTSSEATKVPYVQANTMPDGLYELQYDYLPTSSRNDPANGITNRVDIYVNNTRSVIATQNTQFSDEYIFNNNSGDTYNLNNFVRNDGTNPVAGNFFIPFAYTPVLDCAVNDDGSHTITMTADDVTVVFTEGEAFWTVNNITAFGLSPQGLGGLEWNPSYEVPGGTLMPLSYSFNQIPTSVEGGIQNWRLVTTDVEVHQAKLLNLNMYLGVILSSATYSQATVLSAAQTAISNYLSSLNYDGVVQVSEILALVQNLPGVVAVRFLTDADSAAILYPGGDPAGSNFAIQSVNDEDALIHTYATDVGGQIRRAIDVPLSDDTLASLANLYISAMAQNTFGAV
jgi:uncharacterized phage protein gp47/JayE